MPQPFQPPYLELTREGVPFARYDSPDGWADLVAYWTLLDRLKERIKISEAVYLEDCPPGGGLMRGIFGRACYAIREEPGYTKRFYGPAYWEYWWFADIIYKEISPATYYDVFEHGFSAAITAIGGNGSTLSGLVATWRWISPDGEWTTNRNLRDTEYNLHSFRRFLLVPCAPDTVLCGEALKTSSKFCCLDCAALSGKLSSAKSFSDGLVSQLRDKAAQAVQQEREWARLKREAKKYV